MEMADGTEHALEYVVSGVLFLMAFAMLLWFHGAFMKQTQILGQVPERLILFEQEGR